MIVLSMMVMYDAEHAAHSDDDDYGDQDAGDDDNPDEHGE